MFRSMYSEQLAQYYNLRSKELGENSRKHELCYLRRFDEFLTENLNDDGRITYELITKWLGTLKGKSGTIAGEVIVIRQFLYYLKISVEDIFIPSVPKLHGDYLPYIFTDTELDLIFESADNIVLKSCQADPNLPKEFPVIIRLSYSCGMRIGELVRIELQDVDLENGILRLVHTKGNKQRLVPMAPTMTNILTRYCMAMGLLGAGQGWLFPSGKKDDHISDKDVKRRFETIIKQNGIRPANLNKHERGPCLHCMRHVFVFKSFSKAEKEGRHLDDVVPFLSIYLGHEGIYETAKYLKFSNEIFPEAIDAFGNFMDGILPEVDYGS